jgi:hypothetical protein
MNETALSSTTDRELSPLTGYTRAHWVEIIERLAAGVAASIDPATGIPRLTSDPSETALPAQLRNPGGECEMFERTHLLVATFIAATGRTTAPGSGVDLAASYRRGMLRFIDSSRPDYRWRSFGSASVLAMLLAPQHFVDPLDAAAKKMLCDHLARFIERDTRDCNTMLFSMMPAPLLDRLGGKYDRDLLDGYFDAILSMYRGDGWFIDGWNRGFDNYNFWGFQLYLHALMRFDERWRRRYEERVREITRLHERTLPFFFGSDGGPIPKGRSLNYRFAVLAGMGWAMLSGLSNLEPGLARRISSGCLKYFWEHGCQSERGFLECGYRGANSAVGEDYTDRGAPYWAATGLAALALPETHPFWTAVEQPMPADVAGIKRCLVRGAQMVLKVDGARGEARLLNVGEPFYHRAIWQAGSKYFQNAYSSTLGYPLAGDLGPELGAGRTGLSLDGLKWAWRTWPREVNMDAYRARSEWDAWPAADGITGKVVTESLFLDRGEIHIFWHTDPRPHYLALGGWGIQVSHGQVPSLQQDEHDIAILSDVMWSVMRLLAGVPGTLTMEEVRPRPGFRHAHLFGGWSAYPVWKSAQPVPTGVKVAIFVDAARRREAPAPEWPPIQARADVDHLVLQMDGRGVCGERFFDG